MIESYYVKLVSKNKVTPIKATMKLAKNVVEARSFIICAFIQIPFCFVRNSNIEWKKSNYK